MTADGLRYTSLSRTATPVLRHRRRLECLAACPRRRLGRTSSPTLPGWRSSTRSQPSRTFRTPLCATTPASPHARPRPMMHSCSLHAPEAMESSTRLHSISSRSAVEGRSACSCLAGYRRALYFSTKACTEMKTSFTNWTNGSHCHQQSQAAAQGLTA